MIHQWTTSMIWIFFLKEMFRLACTYTLHLVNDLVLLDYFEKNRFDHELQKSILLRKVRQWFDSMYTVRLDLQLTSSFSCRKCSQFLFVENIFTDSFTLQLQAMFQTNIHFLSDSKSLTARRYFDGLSKLKFIHALASLFIACYERSAKIQKVWNELNSVNKSNWKCTCDWQC